MSDPCDGLRDLFLLRPDVVYLNHGSFGACPRPVFEAYQEWQRELERNPVDFLGRRFEALMAEARTSLARYVGADADDLVYIPNATTGLNIVARSLPLRPGDEVLSTDHEYGALDRTWRFVCGKRGARYVQRHVPLPLTSPEAFTEAVWAGVTPRTRVLFVSHMTSPTAVLFPLAELLRRARERGILTVVDGAHAPGQVPLDLRSLGADFYAGNCHKWMMAPKGSAFLYARREVQPLLEPLVVSWGWESERPGPSPFLDHHQWQGTRDISAFLAVPAAIQFMEEHQWDAVREACHERLRWLRGPLSALTGLGPITPDTPAWTAQMAAFPLPPCDPVALQERLWRDYRVVAAVTTWQGQVFLRVSVQGYNTRSDLEALLDALADLGRRGMLALPGLASADPSP
ncbi:MAG: aminotransferase class V-fold PLP-dependent enzyme [Anaerolineae bacterium]